MNYSKLSDFEINKLVADKLGVYHDGWSHLINGHSNEVPVMVNDSVFWADYCNDACSAWLIILESEISIIRDVSTNDMWEAVAKGWVTMNGFESSIDNKLCHIDKNPLRAAMITFLKMNEEQQTTAGE